MEPAAKVDLMRALAILPLLAFVPLLLATLVRPLRALAERRQDRTRHPGRSRLPY